MTELTTIDTNNYVAMAKAMGIANEGSTNKQKSSTLPRLKINHSAIMGEGEVNGKTVNLEVVEGGTYKLEIPDTATYYSKSIKIRPFLQRFMYKRFIKGFNDQPNEYVKTIMADNLNIDLKDNKGGLNCGKPAGYIEDFKSLPEKTQELIKQIKRVRVILGTVEMLSPVNEKGDDAEVPVSPFIWEIDNRDAFKDVGKPFTDLAKQGVLLINSALTVEEGKPGSHLKLWQPYTNYIIDYISKNHKDIIFVLWGNFAKKKRVIIDLTKHHIIESNHPSPLSANRGGWFGTKPFSKINNKLKELGKEEIIWG